MQFAIKDIVKDNKAHFSFYRSGNMFYTVTVNGTKCKVQLLDPQFEFSSERRPRWDVPNWDFRVCES